MRWEEGGLQNNSAMGAGLHISGEEGYYVFTIQKNPVNRQGTAPRQTPTFSKFFAKVDRGVFGHFSKK